MLEQAQAEGFGSEGRIVAEQRGRAAAGLDPADARLAVDPIRLGLEVR